MVQWEVRLQYSNMLQVDKYADLLVDLEAKVSLIDLFPIEVGARIRQIDLSFPHKDCIPRENKGYDPIITKIKCYCPEISFACRGKIVLKINKS